MGAVLEVTFDDVRADALLRAWSSQAAHLVTALGWSSTELQVRRERNGASLFLTAPVDGLMTATEVNEQAWVAAEAEVAGRAVNVPLAQLRATALAERSTKPHLAAVYAEATARGVTATFDDEALSVGSGIGSQRWPLGAVPSADAVAWNDVHDVPIALVTGSNGKTTTTRLVAAMWRAEGRAAGWCCSDGVWVDDVQLEAGDYAGPAGARTVLRDGRVEAAILETARGGILRRGLAASRADAAIITNISADHFGEYGIDSLRGLAETKAVVSYALGARGCLVLNADDPLLVDVSSRLPTRLAWFSVSPAHTALDAHVLAGGDAATLHGGRVMLHRENVWHDVGAVNALPITLGGAAPHNVENILGASLLGLVMGASVDAIRHALAHFGESAKDNPGRLQVYRFGGATVLVDYAHNPDGLAALCATAKRMVATRRLLIMGQAGNRGDEELRALARAAWTATSFDLVIIKEMVTMLRGREAGQIPRILAGELARLGASSDRVVVAPSELDAVRRAFAWARDGDLLVCPVHVEKPAVLAWLARLRDEGWIPGRPLPAETLFDTGGTS